MLMVEIFFWAATGAAAIIIPVVWKLRLDQMKKKFFKELAVLLDFTRIENYRIIKENPVPDQIKALYYSEIYYQKINISGTRLNTIAIEMKLNGSHDRNFVIESEKLIIYSNYKEEKKRADIQMNDYSFDDAALLTGRSISKVRALLHPEIRRRITEFIKNDHVRFMEYSADRFKVNIQWMSDITTGYIESFYRYLLPFVKLLSREGKTEDLLRQNYLAERYQSVKIKYLESMRAVCRKLESDDEIIEDALKSRNPRLMLEAVRTAGPETYKCIPEIFQRSPEKLRMRILDFLTKYSISLHTDYLQNKHSWMETQDGKLKMLEYYIVIARYKAAGSIRDMIENHNSQTDQYYRECIRALGKCGTYESINYLQKKKNIFNARIIDQAIADIQSRIGTGDAGWLSIDKTEDEEGRLAITETETEQEGP